jgi:DNA-binding NtrC family response regulator
MDEILYPLGEFEYEGKGLPEGFKNFDDKCPHHIFSFDISMIHAGESTLELGYALKNSKRHTIKPFEALPGKISCCMKGDFERNIHRIIYNTCFILAETCIKKHKETFEEKKVFLEQIIEHFRFEYKKLLGLGQRKIIEEFFNEDGIKVEKSVFTDVGRRKGTNKPRKLSEKEIENQKTRKLKILEAMRAAKNSENKTELAEIIGISRPTLQTWLKSIGIQNNRSFYDLIRLAESVK